MNHTRPVLTVHVHAPQPELEQVRKRRRALFLIRKTFFAVLAIAVAFGAGPLPDDRFSAGLLLVVLTVLSSLDTWYTASHSD